MTGALPLSFEMRGNVSGGAFLGDFMVYQDRFEKKLLQLFALQDNSEWFSIISAIIFNIAAEQKKTLVTICSFFYKFPLLSPFYCPPCPIVVPTSLVDSSR